ncbi:MAG: hypothetical protein JKY37_23705 [Nannocystaceae bacterium]|nr:hypothetical protein [Nannocystaceae bacterium]
MDTTLALCLAALTVAPGCFSPDFGTMASADTGGSSGTQSASGAEPEGSETESDDDDIDFLEEFDTDAGLWTFGDDPGTEQEGPGRWEYRNGDLVQLSDVSGPDDATPSRGTYAFGGDVDWDAYRVEVSFTADDDGVVGVLCHAFPNGDYVRFDLDHETGLAQLVRADAGTFTVLAESLALTPPVALGVPRVLGLECGADYRAFVDDTLVLEAPGDISAEGGVGLYASGIGDGPNGLRFHWLEVD